MSKHEAGLALIDEQIEKQEKERQVIKTKRESILAELAHVDKELALANWSLDDLHVTRDALNRDRILTVPPGTLTAETESLT